MNISPRRRRRTFHEHYLRQNGYTLEQIAEQVNVSISTVHADLKLLEENWSLFTQDIHHDLLLHQIARLDRRVEQLGRLDPVADARGALGADAEFTLEQLTQLEDRHERRIARAERELRMLLRQLHNPRVFRATHVVTYPDDELADAETDRKNLKEPEPVQTAIPRKTLEIVANGAAEKSFSESPKPNRATRHSLPGGTGRNQPGHPQDVSQEVHSLELAPEHEAEAHRLTEQCRAAREANDPIAEVSALTGLIDLYSTQPGVASTAEPGWP